MGWRGGSGNEILRLWAREERSEERRHLHTVRQSANKQRELKKIIIKNKQNKKGTKHGMRWKNIRFSVSYVESTVSGQFVCMRVCTCVSFCLCRSLKDSM